MTAEDPGAPAPQSGPLPSDWHLDRKFSLTLVAAIVGQLAIATWFASKMDSRIEVLEQRHLSLAETTVENRLFHIEQRIRLWDRVNAQGEGLNAFRAELAGVNARLEALTRSIDRLTRIADRTRLDPAQR